MTWKSFVNLIVGNKELWKKEFILISQFTTLIAATEEKRKNFDCNFVNNIFSDFLIMKVHV